MNLKTAEMTSQAAPGRYLLHVCCYCAKNVSNLCIIIVAANHVHPQSCLLIRQRRCDVIFHDVTIKFIAGLLSN